MSAEIPPQQMRVGVPSGDGQTAYKRQLAYARLGIKPEEVQCIPYLRADLRRIARNMRSAGEYFPPYPPIHPLQALRSSDDPEARKVLEAFESVPASYRRLLPIEAFCHAAGVSPLRILESIMVVALRQGARASSILASFATTSIAEKTIERALKDDGFRERKMLLLYNFAGFLHL